MEVLGLQQKSIDWITTKYNKTPKENILLHLSNSVEQFKFGTQLSVTDILNLQQISIVC